MLFGAAGMFIAGMVGIVGLVTFWSVLTMRREAKARVTGEAESPPEAAGVWPPPPRC